MRTRHVDRRRHQCCCLPGSPVGTTSIAGLSFEYSFLFILPCHFLGRELSICLLHLLLLLLLLVDITPLVVVEVVPASLVRALLLPFLLSLRPFLLVGSRPL